MGLRQRAKAAEPVLEEEEEFHTESENEDEAVQGEIPSNEENSSASSEIPNNNSYNPPLLPDALLKSKPAEPKDAQPEEVRWDELTSKQKKALRDEQGISMRELREQAKKTGVLRAGRMAQIRRGILQPAEKVAGGRIAKRKRKEKKKSSAPQQPVLSEKQKLLEQRRKSSTERSGKGSVKPSSKTKKRNG